MIDELVFPKIRDERSNRETNHAEQRLARSRAAPQPESRGRPTTTNRLLLRPWGRAVGTVVRRVGGEVAGAHKLEQLRGARGCGDLLRQLVVATQPSTLTPMWVRIHRLVPSRSWLSDRWSLQGACAGRDGARARRRIGCAIRAAQPGPRWHRRSRRRRTQGPGRRSVRARLLPRCPARRRRATRRAATRTPRCACPQARPCRLSRRRLRRWARSSRQPA